MFFPTWSEESFCNFCAYKATKECARDVNIFLFHDNEESRLYINFITQWEDSWERKGRKNAKQQNQ